MAKKRSTPKRSGIIINTSGDTPTAEVYIFNDIDSFWGFSSEDLVNQLKLLDPLAPIEVHINSAGGEVFEGLAIYDILRAWKGEVTTTIHGVAASIAGIIFLAGDKRLIADHGMVMVHNPLFSGLSGTSEEIEDKLELLKKTEASLHGIYASRTGASAETVSGWMDGAREVWFTAEEAVTSGFATEVITLPDVVSRANLSTLAAKLEAHTMFEKWLADYCKPLALDPKTLTEDQLKGLKAVYDKAIKQPPNKAAATDAALTDQSAGTLFDRRQAGNDDDDEKARIEARRKKDAEEDTRQTRIRLYAKQHADDQLSEEYLKSIDVKARTVAGLATAAIRDGWTAERFELECRRAEREDIGHVGIHTTRPISEIGTGGISCALARSTGKFPNSATQEVSKEKYGIEHQWTDMEKEASDDPRLRNISLLQVLDMANQAAGRHYHGRLNSPGFIHHTRDSLYKLRAEGFTTWTGLNIFDDLANKILWSGYQAIPSTWQEWVRVESVSDFKTHNFYRLTMKGGYYKVGADSELKHGDFSDDKYTAAADTYGKMVGLTRHDLINDDLGAFDTIMRSLGMMAARSLEEAFYVYLDAQYSTLFPSAGTYNNYLSGAATVLGVDGLSEGVELFVKQVDGDGSPILFPPEILLVGAGLAVLANELYKETKLQGVQATSPGKIRPDGNPHVGRYRPVVSPYLDNTNIKQITDFNSQPGAALDNQSDTHWLLLANPNTTQGGVVIGVFLNGVRTPTLDRADMQFDFLGLQWRGYHDFGVGNGDPKLGMYCKGAA